MIKRILNDKVKKQALSFPIVAILGPRQSGKTTLAKACFPEKKYVSLENPDQRLLAQSDPKAFLSQFPEGAILDEVQKVPDLFSYLQTLVDEKGENGFFIITGSQNYLLMEKISQSLAGRIALNTLLPFSQEELKSVGGHSIIYDTLLQGGYPRIHAENIDPKVWFENYVQTYLERDVRDLKNIGDLATFTKFIKLCAGRAGNILNLSSLGDDCGVKHNTAKSWLSVLETGYILFLLLPHHKNFNKRLVKSPKIYFSDTGLLCYLLGIYHPEEIVSHPFKGAIFENYVISELLKRKFNYHKNYGFYFWQDHVGHEIDCLVDFQNRLIPIEIKAGETFSQDFFKNFQFWSKLSENKERKYLVYAGDESFSKEDVEILSWKKLDHVVLG